MAKKTEIEMLILNAYRFTKLTKFNYQELSFSILKIYV